MRRILAETAESAYLGFWNERSSWIDEISINMQRFNKDNIHVATVGRATTPVKINTSFCLKINEIAADEA